MVLLSGMGCDNVGCTQVALRAGVELRHERKTEAPFDWALSTKIMSRTLGSAQLAKPRSGTFDFRALWFPLETIGLGPFERQNRFATDSLLVDCRIASILLSFGS